MMKKIKVVLDEGAVMPTKGITCRGSNGFGSTGI